MINLVHYVFNRLTQHDGVKKNKSIFEQDQENMICTIDVIKDLTIDDAFH